MLNFHPVLPLSVEVAILVTIPGKDFVLRRFTNDTSHFPAHWRHRYLFKSAIAAADTIIRSSGANTAIGFF